MSINIKYIAKEAGVSIATVSRVINGNRQVSHENRRKVEEVLNRVDYVPNASARNLVLGRQPDKLVVVTLPPIISPFFSKMLAGVREGLKDRNYRLVLQEATKPSSNEHILRNLDKDGVAGMLVFCRDLSPSERKYLHQHRIPYLLLDYLSNEDHSFAVDNLTGGRMAAEWLVKKNVRRPIYLGTPPTGGGVSEKRWKGFVEFLQQHGISPNLQTIDVDGTSQDFMLKGYQLTHRFFSSGESKGIDGIFYLCDEMALGGMRALRELKIELPVIGFDGWEPAAYLGIATLIQPAQEMGREGAQLLVDKLSHSEPSSIINRLFPPTLLDSGAER